MLAKIFKNILFSLPLLLSVSSVVAQSPYYRQITSRDGLPSMTIYDILEDSKGYLWLATEAGICRYDGVHFKKFKVPKSRGKSFTLLRESPFGVIYFLNFSGQLFRIQDQQVKEVVLPKVFDNNNLQDYNIDEHNNLWVLSKRGETHVLINKTQQWQCVWEGINSKAKSGAIKTYIDNQQNVWLVFNSYSLRVNKKFQVAQKINMPYYLSSFVFLEDQIFACGFLPRRLYVYNTKQQKWRETLEDLLTTTFKNAQGTQIYSDREQKIWVITNNGAIVIDPDHRSQQSNYIFLKGKSISKVIQDREGNHWFTTIGKGLFMMPNRQAIHYNPTNSVLNSSQINAFASDEQGDFFIGTNSNQVFFYDVAKQQINPRFQLPVGDVECLYLDRDFQQLYTENVRLYLHDVQSNRKIKKLKSGGSPKDIDLFQGKYLVVACGNGAYLMSRAGDTQKYPIPDYYLQNYPNKYGYSVFLKAQRSRAIHAEKSGERFWVAYVNSLNYYEEGIEHELKTSANEPIIAANIIEDEEGIVWVGTIQQGIFAIKDRKVIRHVDTQQGLISNFCRVFKRGQTLYLGTDKGLQVYDLKTGTSKVFNQEDGLPSNEIKTLLVHQEKIYLGTPAGLTVLDKDFNTVNTTQPRIYITGFTVKNKPQALANSYSLAYHQNNLNIAFTGIAFRSVGRFQYKYRMLGLDSTWTFNNSASNFARYSSLPSGQYTFEVKVVNEDGIESKQAATVRITIAYPIWEKWWFISLVSLLVVGIFIIILLYRIRAIRRKNRLENALGKATLDALKLQMNPHFIFNALSAVQHYMVKNDGKSASDYLANFAQLMRAVLENSRNEYVLLEEEIAMLEGYLALQTIRFKNNFSYQIEVDEQLDPEEIAIPPMFAQPFIENAIEHGVSPMKEGGIINVSFSLENGMVLLKIEDNGIGYQQSLKDKARNQKEHNSMASKITEERIALYQKSLKKSIRFEIESHNNGTIVKFWLPFQYS